jgi:mono/diheme cytochrome c family protein
VSGRRGAPREWTFRSRYVVAALVVVVVLGAVIGMESQQSKIGDLTGKNETLSAGKAQAIQQRDKSRGALDAAQQELGGERVFEANCAVCHFRDGGGGIGPQLFHGALRGHVSENAEIAKVAGGGPIMPAFGGVLTREEIQQVVAYTRAH